MQAIGAEEEKSVNAKRKYRDGPIDEIEFIDDFLPSPEELAFKEDTVKITISLSKSSVEFFKEKAGQHNTGNQKMIRKLLDSYVNHQSRT